MTQLFPIAAITDEFSQDIEAAVRSMTEIGMGGAELRMVFGKNVIDLTDAALDHAREIVGRHGLEIVSIASPLLKCVLPDAPAVDARFQQDVFAATHTFEDQPRLADRALEIAERTGARIVRVFSHWRSVRPEDCAGVPVERIAHVHAKDCRVEGHRPMWCALGEGGIDWKGQIRALAEDGYKGWISLETHWTGPGGDKHEASVICGRNLMALATGNGTHLFGEE